MTTSAQPPESFEQQVLEQLDRLQQSDERLNQDIERLSTDVEASNARFEKWDGRLWGLTLGLIGTA